MQKILLTIAERCHTAATRRGKDTTGVGCIKSLRIELGEYWKAATWLWEAKAEAGGDFKPERSIDVMLLSGAVQFVCGRMADRHDIERLRKMVNLKMRFNELRKD